MKMILKPVYKLHYRTWEEDFVEGYYPTRRAAKRARLLKYGGSKKYKIEIAYELSSYRYED